MSIVRYGGQYYYNSNEFLNSTEFIIEGQKYGEPGPNLPYAVNCMCAVKLSAEEIFLIGGTGKTGISRNEVLIFNPQKGFEIKSGPTLNTARCCHSCSTMRDDGKTVIVVAGGNNKTEYLDSVEIYDPTDNTWFSGKEIAKKYT